MGFYYTEIVWYILVFSIVSISLNLVIGYTGMFNLGQVGFFALGAAGSTIAVRLWGLPFFVGVLLGVLMSIGGALAIGLPTMKLRGDYFAIATLGFGEIVRVLLNSIETFSLNVKGIPPVTLLGVRFTGSGELVFVFSVFVLVFVFVQRLVDSPFGRVLRAVREDEVAASAMGKDTASYKLTAFLIGAALASLAGSLYVHHLRVFAPTTFNITLTFTMLIMVILGGLGSNLGAVAGTVTIALINELPKKFSYPGWLDPGALHLLLYSTLMILIMLYRPQGLLGEQEAGK